MNFPIPKHSQKSVAPTEAMVEYGPNNNKLVNDQFALPNSKANAANGHPMQASEENHGKLAMREELYLAQRMFGRALSQQLSLELNACSQVGRLRNGPLASSGMMAEVLTGMDEYVGFDSYLNNPQFDEQLYDMGKSMRNMK